MVGVVVGVDDSASPYGHAVGGGDLVHRPAQVVADAAGVEHDYPSRVVKNADRVDPVGDPVQVPRDPPD